MQRIFLDFIKSNPWQPRQVMDGIEDLAADILARSSTRPETSGLLQLPAVRIVDGDGILVPEIPVELRHYNEAGDLVREFDDLSDWMDYFDFYAELAFGHRRLEAFKHLARKGKRSRMDWIHLPCEVIQLSDQEMAAAAWSENAARQDLSPIEQAESIQKMMEDFGWTQEHAARRLGMSRSTLANKIRLLKLPDQIRDHAMQGEITERQALALLPFYDLPPALIQKAKDMQIMDPDDMLDRIIQGGLSSDQIRSEVAIFVDYYTTSLDDIGFNADHHFEDPAVKSPSCLDCPEVIKRGSDLRCTSQICREVKSILWRQVTLERASEFTGIPILDLPEGVERYEAVMVPFNSDKEHRQWIQFAMNTKKCPNLRLEWAPYGDQYRLAGFEKSVGVVCLENGRGCSCLGETHKKRLEDKTDPSRDWELAVERKKAAEARLFDQVIQPAGQALAAKLKDDHALALHLAGKWLVGALVPGGLPAGLQLPEDPEDLDGLLDFWAAALVSFALPDFAENDLAGAKWAVIDYLGRGAGLEIPAFVPSVMAKLNDKLARLQEWIQNIDEGTPEAGFGGNIINVINMRSQWEDLPADQRDPDFADRCQAAIDQIKQREKDLEAEAEAWLEKRKQKTGGENA